MGNRFLERFEAEQFTENFTRAGSCINCQLNKDWTGSCKLVRYFVLFCSRKIQIKKIRKSLFFTLHITHRRTLKIKSNAPGEKTFYILQHSVREGFKKKKYGKFHIGSWPPPPRLWKKKFIFFLKLDHFLRTFCKKCIFTIENPKKT